MRPLVALMTLSTVLGAVLVAGCVDCPSGPPVTARGIGADTDDRAGLLGTTLTVRVTAEPGGPPLEGAGVVVYWASERPTEWRGDTITVSDGEHAVVVPLHEAHATPAAEDAVRLRTNARGEAYARVPSDRVVGVVAAADGWTEEWIPALATGSRGDDNAVTLPLYHATLNATVEDAWALGDASTGFMTRNNYAWLPTRLPFGDADAVTRGYAERLATLDVRLEWENGLEGGGDLGIGLGPSADEATFLADESTNAAPGAQSESLTMSARALAEQGLLATDLHVGPATDSARVGVPALPFTLTLTATFDTAFAQHARCATPVNDDEGWAVGASTQNVPGAGAIAALAVVASVAVLLARRRERPR